MQQDNVCQERQITAPQTVTERTNARRCMSARWRYRKAGVDDVLLLTGELFRRQGRSSEKMHVETKERIGKTGDFPAHGCNQDHRWFRDPGLGDDVNLA